MKKSRAMAVNLPKALILSLILSCLLLSLAAGMTIDSEFKCSNSKGETTFYSYLKEPRLQESNYTYGLKTGTLNYYKGDKADLTDKLDYYDGNVDGDHPAGSGPYNASVTHNLKVTYSGKKETSHGLSQFFAKGFYTDNRVVSASKKFWFNSQTSYPVNNLSVQATANMDLKGTYDLKYSAVSENAYFVFNDVTGFTNKTGARRIDWEQEGLLKGQKVNVTNNLRTSSDFIPRLGGVNDWLPCTCLSGSDPLIEPKDGEWPSEGVYTILQQPYDKILLQPVCVGDLCKNTKYLKTAANWRGAGSLLYLDTESNMVEELTSTLPIVQVDISWEPNVDKTIADYTIKVSNLGNINANSVVLTVQLAPGLNYVGTSATINDVPKEPYRPFHNESMFWNIGDLLPTDNPNGVKIIRFEAKIGKGADPDATTAYATYRGGTQYQQNTFPTESAAFASLPPANVSSFYMNKSEGVVHYTIHVKNLGTVEISEVTLVNNLTNGMTYQEGATVDGVKGRDSEPKKTDGDKTLTWNLGNLLPFYGQKVETIIEFDVAIEGNTDPAANIAYAMYKVGMAENTTEKVNSKRILLPEEVTGMKPA